MKPVTTSHDFLISIRIKMIHDARALFQLRAVAGGDSPDQEIAPVCKGCLGLRGLVGEVHRNWHKDKAIPKGAEEVSEGGEGMRAGW